METPRDFSSENIPTLKELLNQPVDVMDQEIFRYYLLTLKKEDDYIHELTLRHNRANNDSTSVNETQNPIETQNNASTSTTSDIHSQRVEGDNDTHSQRVEDDMDDSSSNDFEGFSPSDTHSQRVGDDIDDSSSSGFSGFSNGANDIQNSNDTHSSSADCSGCSSVSDFDYDDPITPYQEEDEYQSPWYDSDGNEVIPGHQFW